MLENEVKNLDTENTDEKAGLKFSLLPSSDTVIDIKAGQLYTQEVGKLMNLPDSAIFDE